MREGFRLSYDQLPKGVDLVLIAAKPKLRPQLASLQEELVHLAHKAHRRYRKARVASLPDNSLPPSPSTQGESR
jgi:RNase P protein component